MKKFLISVFLIATVATSFAWDFFLSDGTWTRRANPFEIKENRVFRSADPLEAKAKFDDNNNLIIYTEYNDAEYVCQDGTVPIPENAPRRISILKLVMAIRAAGKYPEFMAFLESSGYKELFFIAQEFTTDHELFVAGREAAQQALGLTDEEVEAILSAAYLPVK